MSEQPTPPEEELGVEADEPPPLPADMDDPIGGMDEIPERIDDLDKRLADLEMGNQQTPQLGEDVFEKVFPATLATDNTFTELIPSAGTLTPFLDGRTGSVIPLAPGQSILIEVQDPDVGTNSGTMRFLELSGGAGGPGSLRAVLVKAVGADGFGYPTYDVYDLADTGLTTPLGTSLSPTDARWRGATGLNVVAAPDGSVEVAYYDAAGNIGLITAAETICTSDMSVTGAAV